MQAFEYDIIVVGAGHAGCEAASVAAKMGRRVLLLTLDMNNIAQLSCNPAMGGIAKGQIVREIDALGGKSAIVTDACTLQFRMLNRSKGPAMWSPRAQLDRSKFILRWREELDATPNLDIRQDMVRSLLVKGGVLCGVVTTLWGEITAPKVILTAGTFLGGLMHFGKTMIPGGRIAEPSVLGLTEQLKDLGFRSDRMKTGTPPRIDGRSVDFSLCEPQYGDEEERYFSFMTQGPNLLEKKPCHIFYTSKTCHDILHASLHDSPLYNGQITSIGPRYCPSIETKIVTFAEKDRHQLFLEPEGENSNEYYLNGFSSSLPLNVQLKALRTLPPLRSVRLYRPGYAIEYDFFDPTQLAPTLESMILPGLFLAGQVNGTTGYEEAAGQGIIAGINAVLSLEGKNTDFILARNEAYIGVLIDDLVTKGVDEPYRMFTSRAEFRTILRQDTADERLTPYAEQWSIATQERTVRFHTKKKQKDELEQFIRALSVTPAEINDLLLAHHEKPLSQGMKLSEVLLRPHISLHSCIAALPRLCSYVDDLDATLRREIVESVEIRMKYQGYIAREIMEAERMQRLENIKLGDRFDYLQLDNISIESRQKLDAIRPRTIGQASRIPGVSPHDISVLILLASR